MKWARASTYIPQDKLPPSGGKRRGPKNRGKGAPGADSKKKVLKSTLFEEFEKFEKSKQSRKDEVRAESSSQ